MVTDYKVSYALFIYNADGMNWNAEEAARKVVVGYQVNDMFYVSPVSGTDRVFKIDQQIGNTGNLAQIINISN